MQPNSCEEWINVSKERQDDARALAESRKESTAPVYMAGYAVEASLKAYLKNDNKTFPKKGDAGHNLRGLWNRAGFKKRDIKDESGETAFFIENWSTDLRYEVSPQAVQINDPALLVEAAGKLAGWVQRLIRRKNLKRGKR